jgi:uncharacterized protein with HEPN domain
MRKADRVRLQHMLDAANEALSFIQGRTRSDLDNDRMLVLSLIRELEIIGEAASQNLSGNPITEQCGPVARYYGHAQSSDPRVF